MKDIGTSQGDAVTDGLLSEASGIASTVATPLAAPAADQPSSLSSPLAFRFLTLPAPYLPISSPQGDTSIEELLASDVALFLP